MKSSAFESFSEEAQEALDFTRCERPNGTFYGTSGQCKSGAQVGAKEKKAAKGKSSGGGVSDSQAAALSKDLTRQIGEAARSGDAKKTDNLMKAKDAVDQQIKVRKAAKSKPAASSGGAPSSKEVRALDRAAKAADKKADAADRKFQKSKSPADRKEARRLDKEAKAANKAADKADKAFQKGAKAKNKPAADPDKAAKSEERAAKQLKSAKSKLRMEANSLKQMRDAGITDSRINAAAASVRSEKMKVEKLRNAAAKKSGKARPEKSTMTSRIAKEERDIRRKAGAGNAKSKQYVDLKKRIQEGKVEDPISARRQLSSLRAELKPASPNQ